MVNFFFVTRQNYELFFINSKQIKLYFFRYVFLIYCRFVTLEWFASQTKFKTVIQNWGVATCTHGTHVRT